MGVADDCPPYNAAPNVVGPPTMSAPTPKGQLILLEEIPDRVRLADKLWAALVAKVVPAGALATFVPGLRDESLEATATVIFTSGSTGDPKGVVLTHRNILSNAHQVEEQVRLRPDEVLLGILPFFHAFGFTITYGLISRIDLIADPEHFRQLDLTVVT